MTTIKPKRLVIYSILILFVFILVFPFIWLSFNSFRNPADLFGNVSFMPINTDGEFTMTLDNYTKVFRYLKLPLLFKNTLVVAITNTVLNLLLNAMAGYSFARMEFKGRDLIFKIVITSLMIPGTVMLVPNMIIVQKLGIYDSLPALIVPFVMSVYNVFLMRQHFLSHSKELEESAVMDGANWFTIFFRISLPLAKPMMVVLGLFTFMWNYGNFMWPLIVLNDPDNYTLSRGLGKLIAGSANNTEKYGMMLAGSVIVALPLIVLFLVFQKSIVKGINVGGIKE